MENNHYIECHEFQKLFNTKECVCSEFDGTVKNSERDVAQMIQEQYDKIL
jgi:hypothetical protein